EERGIYAFGQSSDMSKFGPKAHLTSITDDWDGYYINRAKAVLDGTWKSEDTWGGLDSGMVVLSPYNPNLPKDVVAMADQIKNDL
ncbi:BMP family ABC transporter substrate-binding protein, partial [Acinetobacter baumannii]